MPRLYLSKIGHERKATLLGNPEPRPAVLPLQVSACQHLLVVVPKLCRLRRPATPCDMRVAQLYLHRETVLETVVDCSALPPFEELVAVECKQQEELPVRPVQQEGAAHEFAARCGRETEDTGRY